MQIFEATLVLARLLHELKQNTISVLLKKIEWLSGQNIEGKIFEGCKNIKEIFISDKVKNIEVSAFASSPNVEISFI